MSSGSTNKAGATTRYTGFRPKHFQQSSQKVSGELEAFVSDARQTKFRRSAVEIIEPNQYASNTTIMGNTVKKADFMNRPKPVRMVQKNNNPAKCFQGTSAAHSDHVNFQVQIKAFANERPGNYEHLFHNMDADGNGSLDIEELRQALARRNVSSGYITHTLMAHFDQNADGKVTWAEFARGLERAKEQLTSSVNFKQVSGRVKPSWELKKAREVKVVSHEERPSMAQVDFTEGGISSHPLTQGTPQGTQHIPGYSGHLPSTSHNDTAVTQSSGSSARSDKNNLILIETYNPKVKAFTEVKYGKMRTMNSVTDQLVKNMWDSRSAKPATER